MVQDRTNDRIDGGMLAVRWLKAAGIQNVFSVSGGPLNSIYRACSVLELPLVHTRHEAAACFMAEAASRVTRTPGVAAVTLGPGATNAVTPALVSTMAGTPLLILAAQAPTSSFERGAGMSWDPLPIFSSVTKWAARVHEVERIPEYLSIAWRKMWAGRPGPVFLELPVDVLTAETHAPLDPAKPPATVGRPKLSGSDAVALQAALVDSRRPVAILGDELFWEPAAQLEAALAHHRIPFATLRLARGVLDERKELWAGPAYLPCNETLRRALGESDLVLLLGHHFEFDLGFGQGINPAATIVQIASDPDLLGRNKPADLAIQATPASAAPELLATAPMHVDREWVAEILDDWKAERAAQLGSTNGSGLHPVAAVDAVCAAAPPNTIFVSSHGNVDFWADARLRLRRPGRYLRAGQSGALGAELPYAVGARFADPSAPVVVFVGDGGVGYHLAELDTAERYGRPVIVVVLDDESWGAIALPQEAQYGETFEMALPQRDWVKVAEGLGCGGAFATNGAAVTEAVSQALEADTPQLIQVPVASVISPYMSYISG